MRSRWRILLVLGLFWLVMGVSLVVDALDGDRYFPLRIFGCMLAIEGIAMAVTVSSRLATRRILQLVRACVILILAGLVLMHHHLADIFATLLFGTLFAVDGALRIASAVVVRFPGWRAAFAGGAAELVLAVTVLEPWPVYYSSTIEYCIGVAIGLSGWGLLRLSWRLRNWPIEKAFPLLYSRGWPDFPHLPLPRYGEFPQEQKLVVHVWTAFGTAKSPQRQLIVDRYIAAISANGVISTGHAALSLGREIYISHYPAVEIDHSPQDFYHLLRAIPENNVPGTFQPSYEYEAQQWCESTVKVEFDRYDPERLRKFWEGYRQDTTYNLTNRNCSSVVAHALETAVAGALSKMPKGSWLRTLFSPELMVAAQLRYRAETMAWTPGLMLDYARALNGALNPPRLTAEALWRLMLRRVRAPRVPDSGFNANTPSSG